MKWYKIASGESDIILNPNNISEIDVAGKVICIAKGVRSWYAFSQKCPHAGGFMSDGYLDAADNVVCPLHRYKFNLSNGRNTLEGYYLKTFPLEIRSDGIYVSI